ncbi:protein FLC EXPRESSOR [Heracleum sosnowskyi]|uniref:Protein FLC EXPRESSOR n=1 Tax=Heracleum sosnowskyi TaxID=360622 RepID=A0AAD8GUB8_9APIA|nr:protein FLC EXPRESSOR [Heracleum sosnowskyi]
MAGRNPPPPHHHLLRPDPTQIAELSSLQHRHIHSLLVDNQRLAAIHVALKQELALSHQELRHLSTSLSTIKLESDAKVREVLEKAAKMESEVRVVREFNGERERVREDVRRMEEDRRELVGKLGEVEKEVKKVRESVGEVEGVREEIEVMRREILKGRAAVEYEKKLHASNIELGQIMEENMVSMAHEIEKLQAELANAEKMARAAAAAAAAASPGPAYTAGYGNSDLGYSANSYAGPYAAQQFQGNVDSGSQYGSGAAAHGHYGTQQNRVP